MKIIINNRRSGKTTKLIEISAAKNIPIVTRSKKSSMVIKQMSYQLNLAIPEPYTYDQLIYKKDRLRGIKTILIDDADELLQSMLYHNHDCDIDTITLTSNVLNNSRNISKFDLFKKTFFSELKSDLLNNTNRTKKEIDTVKLFIEKHFDLAKNKTLKKLNQVYKNETHR